MTRKPVEGLREVLALVDYGCNREGRQRGNGKRGEAVPDQERGGKGGLYHEIDGDPKRRSSSSCGSGSEWEAQWCYLEWKRTSGG